MAVNPNQALNNTKKAKSPKNDDYGLDKKMFTTH